MNSWQAVMRPELLQLSGYSAASDARDLLRLHANEAPQDPGGNSTGLNRYPVPQPTALIDAMADYYGVDSGEVLPVRGSDDAIDLLVRSFCRAGRDSVLVCPPTFGMYEFAVRLQDARCVTVPLLRENGFQVDYGSVLAQCTGMVRLVFLCSPNNPTGNVCTDVDVLELAAALAGRAIVVVDEAYIEFARKPSIARRLHDADNLVVLRTLSKALGLAGIRCGALLAQAGLVERLRCLMPPYPLPAPTIDAASRQLLAAANGQLEPQIDQIRSERDRLAIALHEHPDVHTVWNSEGNFLLLQPAAEARDLEARCRDAGILVRYFAADAVMPACLRVTVGSPDENDRLLDSLAVPRERAHG
ncbi:MAG: histidinol-phosphate transaminase [Gammaproteobacteria bacterium]|nr:histidinol-phosphate transaminase [Gammaproteobacteria bacterium]NNF62307.1 histidinol-phosphate transaminase [Gammaproteobacteria bacterium]NNM21212.1 histidinol-phosphate transaminase [Gammaproteobacteria bacterium]